MEQEDLSAASDCIDSGLQWNTVLNLAERHRVGLLLERQLSRHFSSSVPEDFLAVLRQRSVQIAARSLHLTRVLLDVLRIAGQEGISLIPYKGPTLAAIAYGTPADRDFHDIDLLVAAPDVDRLTKALLQSGYTPGLRCTPFQTRSYLRTGCQLPIRSPHSDLIELQWQIMPHAFSLDIRLDQLFARSQPITLAGMEIPQLSPPDALVILCVHGGKHRWERLAWICDISELLRSVPDGDWRQSAAYARQIGAERFLIVGLSLAQRLLRTVIPASLETYVQSDRKAAVLVSRLTFRSTRVANSDDATPGDGSPPPSYFWYLLGMRERWRDKLAYAFRLVFTPGIGELSIVELPATLAPLYSVIRILRLLCRFILWPFKRGTRRDSATE